MVIIDRFSPKNTRITTESCNFGEPGSFKVFHTRMEETVEDIENKMKKTDERLDTLAVQVGNIEHEIFSEDGQEIEVNNLLKSVGEVKDNYQNLRKEIMEVQDLQKQLSSSLNLQLKLMQSKFHLLKEKINMAEVSKFGSRPKSPAHFLDNSK